MATTKNVKKRRNKRSLKDTSISPKSPGGVRKMSVVLMFGSVYCLIVVVYDVLLNNERKRKFKAKFPNVHTAIALACTHAAT